MDKPNREIAAAAVDGAHKHSALLWRERQVQGPSLDLRSAYQHWREGGSDAEFACKVF